MVAVQRVLHQVRATQDSTASLLPEVGRVRMKPMSEFAELAAALLAAVGSLEAAVTICDAGMKILYMNSRSIKTFESSGGRTLIGGNLRDCHKPASIERMEEMLRTGEPNSYTIRKAGVKKLIWQSVWRIDGRIAGLVEVSIPLPEILPHFDRD